jgi:hypothetical protein
VGGDVARRGLLGPVDDGLDGALLEADAGLAKGLAEACHAGLVATAIQLVGERLFSRPLAQDHAAIVATCDEQG